MKITNQTFTEEDISLDGNVFEGCTFSHCRLIYAGGALPKLRGNNMVEPDLIFVDAAKNAIVLLAAFHAGGMEGVVEPAINFITNGVGGDTDILSAGIIE